MSRAEGKRKVVPIVRYLDGDDDVDDDDDASPCLITTTYHSTKNRRISGKHRSAHAVAHFQNGVVDKPPLEKMVAKEVGGELVIADWAAIKGATLHTRAKNIWHIVDEDLHKYPLAQSYTERYKNGSPKEGAVKLKEKLGAEDKLKCFGCPAVLGDPVCDTAGKGLGVLGVSSFQLDHHDPKRPTMSQGRGYADYLHAYEQGHIVIKCYEYMGLQYNLQGMQHGGNSRNYAAP